MLRLFKRHASKHAHCGFFCVLLFPGSAENRSAACYRRERKKGELS